MPSSRAIEAGRAVIKLGMPTKGVENALKRLQAISNKIGAGFQKIGARALAVGTAITGAFTAAAKHFGETGGHLARMSAATGESVENLSKLSYAAGQSGIEFDDLVGAAEELNIRLGEAAREGTGPLAETFAKLGLDVQKIIDMPLPERLAAVGDAINSLPDNAAKQFAADEIFGGDAFRILPLITSDVGDLVAEAEALGVVMSGEDAQAAKELNRALGKLWAQVRSLVNGIGASVAGELTEWLSATQTIARSAIDWANKNRELLSTVFKIGVAISAAGAALVALGTGFILIGLAASGLAATISAIGAVLGALFSPIGVVVALIAGLATWFVTSTNAGRMMAEKLGAYFGELWSIAKQTFDGIRDALAGGDMQAAADVLWAGLRLAWLKGTEALRAKWAEFKNAFLRVVTEIRFGVEAIFAKMVASVKKLLVEMRDFAADSFDVVVHYLAGIGETDAVKEELARMQAEKIGARMDARRGEIGGIDEEKNNALAEIELRKGFEEAQRQQALEAELEQQKKSLEAARAELESATAKAAEVRAAAEAGKAKAKEQTAGVDTAIEAVKASTKQNSTQAIFDTRFARQQFGGKPRTEKLLEDIKRNTDPKNRKPGMIPVI